MAAMQMAFITTVLHEVGHAYDLYVRDSAASPSVSSAAGREDVVLERGLDAWAIKNADGIPKQVGLGEASDLVEQRLLGNTYTLSALSQRLADNPWLSFPGVEVQEINQVNYAFSHIVVGQWLQDFAALRLTELSLDNALPVASGRDLTRLKLVDALDSHRPAVNPTNSQRGNRLLHTIDMTGRTSTRVSYGVISRGPTRAAGNGNF